MLRRRVLHHGGRTKETSDEPAINPATARVRVSPIGLVLLGAVLLFASIANAVGNLALGNTITAGFLLELLAFGIGGAIAMFIGGLAYVRTLHRTKG